MKARASVVSVGARTSIGLNALQTTMLFRAGAAGMAMAPLADIDGEQVTMCFDKTLPPTLVGWERAAALAAPALEEALAPLVGVIDGSRTRLLMCIDERYGRAPKASRDADAGAALVTKIAARASALLPGITPEVTARGHASAAVCLPEGLSLLDSRSCDALVLGSVHTDYEPAWINELSERGRLFKSDNLDSFIAGEAAAFVVLMRDDVARRSDLESMAEVVNVALGAEAATPDNDLSAFDAKGLTRTIRKVAEPLPEGMTAGWAVTDLTFEMRRVHEWQAMLTRTREVWSDPYAVDSPAQRIGQLGAAAMPLGITLVAQGWRCRSAPAPIAVVYAGSEGGARGAVLLVAPKTAS